MRTQSSPERTYTPLILASVPRSGSNLLRSLLNNHPDILVHGEVFNDNRDIRLNALSWTDRPCVPYESGAFHTHLEKHVFPLDAGGMNVVGFKLFPFHCNHAPGGKQTAARICMSFPELKVILLERTNLLDIALSALIEKRDKVWTHYVEKRTYLPHPLRVTPEQLTWHMQYIQKEQECIRQMVNGCDVVHITYDDLTQLTESTMCRLQEWLNVDVLTLQPNSFIRKQRILPRTEMLTDFAAHRAHCAVHHPEWLHFFDEPEHLTEVQHTKKESGCFAVQSMKPSHDPQAEQEKSPSFYLQVFHDEVSAEQALRRLRAIYPHARIILQSDGDDNPVYEKLSARHSCEYFSGKRLYLLENGGKMVQRMLNDYLAGEGGWMVKIDTDTRVDRQFEYLPDNRAVYGQPLRQGPPQGGCLIIPRAVAEELRDSRILLSPKLRTPLESWGQRMSRPFLEDRIATTGCIGFEWTLYWACQQLGIPVVRHPEIHATWKQGDINADKQFAAVHPDKFLHVDDEQIHDLCTENNADVNTIWLDAMAHTA